MARRIPLLTENEGMLYPSLTLSVLTLLAGDKAVVDFGRATTPDGCFTASPTDDNYGFDVKVMWFALEAEGLLDERFGRVMHSN
jgi:hypothetical protein